MSASIVITDTAVTALTYIYDYRYLSIKQVAVITGLKDKSTSELLLRLERQKLLGSFGNVGIRGYGKTPKVYYLTKSGHGLLAELCEDMGEDLGPYRPVNMTSRWSPVMYHRLATLDVMMALERDGLALNDYHIPKTFVEYRREKINGGWRRETTDYVANRQIPENRIVPDAGFILEHTESGKRALFLVEVDCGTESLTTSKSARTTQTIAHKINQYDRYLTSKRVTDRYKDFGDFTGFTLLLITNSEKRLHNMRDATRSTNDGFYRFYRLSILDAVSEDFFHDGWYSRDTADHATYRLMRGN